MQMTHTVTLVTLLGVSASAPAGPSPIAARNDTSHLAESCRDVLGSDDAFGSGYCLGFIQGVRDLAQIMVQVTPKEHLLCIPPQVTTGQLSKVFVRWADNHPEQLHIPPVVGVHRSIIAAFPCGPDATP